MSPSLYDEESAHHKDDVALKFRLLGASGADKHELLPEDSKHRKALHNLKIFVFWFLVFDVITVATYGHQTWMDSKVLEVGASTSLMLEGMVTLFFSFDVILASALWWYLWSGVEWEEMASLINTNLLFNVISLTVLACQRVFHARHDDRLMLPALVYLCVRARKVRRFGQLKKQVTYASSHSDDPSRYDDLLKTWAPETDTRVERCMLATTVISMVVLVTVLAAASVLDATSVGNTTTVLPSAATNSSAATNLSALPEVLVENDHRLDNAAAGAGVGASYGGAIGEIAGPEMIPVGGAVGGAIGGTLGLLDPWR